LGILVAMALQFIASSLTFLGLGSRPVALPVAAPAISEPGPLCRTLDGNPCYWNILPNEVRKLIINFVLEPTRTALIDKRCRLFSFEVYPLLLDRYAAALSLAGYLKDLPPDLTALGKVKIVYDAVSSPAKKFGIKIPSSYLLSPSHLEQRKQIVGNVAQFCRAAFRLLNQDLSAMTDNQVIEYSKQRLQDYKNVFEIFPGELSLEGQNMTLLPPQIGMVKSLTGLNLNDNCLTTLPPEMASLTKLQNLWIRSNPLDPVNVRKVCKTLSLQTVNVDHEQTALIEMFQQDFPEVALTVTKIYNIDVEI
jgi:hypothetical protein